MQQVNVGGADGVGSTGRFGGMERHGQHQKHSLSRTNGVSSAETATEESDQ